MSPIFGARCATVLLFALFSCAAWAQVVSLVGGTPPVQDFDSLVNSGTSATLPPGWYLAESDDNANSEYRAGDGSSNSGDTYSFGTGTSSERAPGTLLSGSLVSQIGARLRNDSGQALSEILVSYTGEQWRLGTTGRADLLKFEYSTNATALTDAAANWTAIPALDFPAPINSGTTGAVDGNDAGAQTAISASITGLNLGANATLWVRWADINASSNDDGLAIDNISFAVAGDPPVDLPPTVVSTTPANGAVNVPLAATLSVGFSEAVSLVNPWSSLVCASSGSHGFTLAGGPTSYTLTPSPGFAVNEVCTWTILASGVTDLDGIPDALEADTVITFTTLDPTSLPPPTVLSTVPADGASQVPPASDLRVTFSESVTTTASAFALVCDANPIRLSETGSGANRALTPDTLLPTDAACTFTIQSSQVTNANGVPMAQSETVDFRVSDGSTSGYYDQVNTSSVEQLRCSLHLTIRGHTAYPYSGSGTNTWTILEAVQANPSNPNRSSTSTASRLYRDRRSRRHRLGPHLQSRTHLAELAGFSSTREISVYPTRPIRTPTCCGCRTPTTTEIAATCRSPTVPPAAASAPRKSTAASVAAAASTRATRTG